MASRKTEKRSRWGYDIRRIREEQDIKKANRARNLQGNANKRKGM